MRVGAFVEETNMETNTMKATSSFGPLPMGNVDTTEVNGKNASWNEDGTGREPERHRRLRSVCGEPAAAGPPVLTNSCGQGVSST